MNRLMPVLQPDPTLQIFAICAGVLTLKVVFMVTLIGILRNSRGAFVTPEDYQFRRLSPGPPDELVERVRRAHQNDIENIPIFLAVGFLFAVSGGYPTVARWAFVVFTVSRFLHTACYLAGLQPWRSLIFAVGSVALVIMAVLLIWWGMFA
jgi:glutathione S-transferase